MVISGAAETTGRARQGPDPRPLPRVAIAHDWLVRYAGSERCVAELLAMFPGSPLLTTVLDRDELPGAFCGAETSFLDSVPGARTHHEWLLPLMPLAWKARKPIRDVDLVISSSHACAKAVRVARGIPHICYCHTPIRYAWDFEAEAARFPAPLRLPARAAVAPLRSWDRSKSRHVTRFVANSNAVAERIRKHYSRDARVVHPPVRTEFFTPSRRSMSRDYFLYVGRLVAYKRPDLVVEAFSGTSERLVVVGTGQMEHELRRRATANVEFLAEVDDRTLRRLYRGARALVYPADEDFGIVMAEAQACGTPVIGLARGGALDIVVPGLTGWLIERQDVTALRRAVSEARSDALECAAIRRNAERFSPERFRAQMSEIVDEVLA